MFKPFGSEPFTATAAYERGLTPRDIACAVDAGVIRRLFQGVFVHTSVADSVALRVAALRQVVCDDHIAIDRTAAWLHGLEIWTLHETVAVPPIEVAVVSDLHPTERPEVIARRRLLTSRDLMDVSGMRVTTPLRTALDLGCNLRRREAYAALNSFSALYRVTPEDLKRELVRFRRRRGVIQLRELIEIIESKVESPRESWTLLAVLDAGIERPEAQYWVEIDGVPTYRLDFAWIRQKVAVEYDGIEAHRRTAEQERHDRARRQHLRELGWVVIVVAIGDFTPPALDQWLLRLRQTLREADYTPLRWVPRTTRRASM